MLIGKEIMCGICGVVSNQNGISEQVLREMLNEMSHRGPDASDVRLFNGETTCCGLGHVRLSIIDLAGGAQPMTNENGTIWITYNGEVYNHQDLRKDLEAKGHVYQTNSDTETLIHLYEEYGVESPKYLRGMFAYAIWDDNKKRMFLVRDRLGIKPLYYTKTSDGIVFASEIKALFKSKKVKAVLAQQHLAEYFSFGYLTNENTMFESVHKLLPGQSMVFENGGEGRLQQYWSVDYNNQQQNLDENEVTERLKEMFHTSVDMRMMSDVPLGMFLSGGFDSSAIASIMSRLSSQKLKAFTIGFDDKYYSEAGYAKLVADRYGMDLHEVKIGPEDFVNSIENLIWHNDLPIHFPASVALYFVSKEARKHVKVVLTGEGSDELFGGYGRYMACDYNVKIGKLLDPIIPEKYRELLRNKLWQTDLPLKLKKALAHSFLYHSMDPRNIIFDNYYKLDLGGGTDEVINEDFLRGSKQEDPYQNYMEHFDRFSDRDTISRMLYTDQKTYLEELLMKQDKMSMATSIESRVPFLDHKLVEYAATLPSSMKVRICSLKHVIKKAVGDFVPKEIIQRKKMGFPVPLGTWMREPMFNTYLRDILLDSTCRQRGVFQVSAVEHMLDDHQKGTKENTYKIWMMLNFELWCRTYLGRTC